MPLDHLLDHRDVVIDQLGEDSEAVVIDDGVDLVPDRLQRIVDRLADAFDVLGAAHIEPLEIDKEQVLAGIVVQALGERDFQHLPADVHRLVAENAGVHQLRFALDDRPEVHLVEDVLL